MQLRQRTIFQHQVQTFIEAEKLFCTNDCLLVALSGGADSVALLHVLCALGYYCVAAHCNFHLRGEESNRDEAFCRALCEQLNIHLHVTHFDTMEYAKEKGVSIEMAARELRYAWFETLCQEEGYTCVAVAHHRDDNVETLLLNLVRGTGIAGLRGMKPINGLVVRPLLNVTRQDILSYLNIIGQSFVTDSTNLQDEYVRNKIRLQIIPLLEKINPQVSEKISDSIRHLREVESIYDKAMREAILRVVDEACKVVHIPSLLAEVEPRAVLFEILRSYGFVSAQVDDIFRSLTAESGRSFINKGWKVLKDRDCLLIRPNRVEEKAEISIAHAPAEVTLGNGTTWVMNSFPLAPDYHIPRTPDVATFDAGKVEFPLTIRPWRKGDKFAPFGMNGRKKLVSDLLTDLKLSLFEKETQQVVTDAHGHILWVIGLRTDERARVTDNTMDVLEMKIK